jgi:hypothetical protein
MIFNVYWRSHGADQKARGTLESAGEIITTPGSKTLTSAHAPASSP